MKKTYYFLILCVLGLFACGKEDALTPNEAPVNYFIIPADATDAESVLRREFYEKYGVHLLFNDTLHHELGGYYSDGTPYYNTELLDIRYSMTYQDLTEMSYNYITDIEDQRQAVEIVETDILSHLGEKMLPYSMLLVRNLQVQDWGILMPTAYYKGERCFVINAGTMSDTTDSARQDMCNDIFSNLIINALDNETITLENFYAYGMEYYGGYFMDYGLGGDYGLFLTQEEVEYVNSLGFLGDINTLMMSFPTSDTDLNNYVQAIIYDTEDNFKATYAAYPIILEKYDILKEVIEESGFKF